MTMLTKDQVTEVMAQHAAAVGKVGSGKTYTAKGFVEQLANAGRRVAVLDPTGVWWGLRSSSDGKRAGLAFVIFGGEHADVKISEHSGAAVAKLIATKNLLAVVDISELMKGERQRFVSEFTEELYRLNRSPLHLVIDEADEFCPQNPMPDQKVMLNHVDRIVRRGRVRGFRVFMITQRPAVLHKNVLTQINTLIALRLTSPQDRKAIQAWIEGNADEGDAAKVMKTLPGLKVGEGWVWAPESDILIRQQFPRIKTFDSSRTPGDDETIEAPTKLADVDLAEIRETFAAVEKEAETMEELRARVRELERGAPTKRDEGSISQAQVEELLARQNTLHALRSKDLAVDLVAAIRPIEQSCAGLRSLIEARLSGEAQPTAEAVRAGFLSRDQVRAQKAREDGGLPAEQTKLSEFVEPKRHPLKSTSRDLGALPKGERAILIACAQTKHGADRTQLTLLTGFKKSTRNRYLQYLQSKGLVSEDHGRLFATAGGFSALGKFERLPTGDALARYWLQKLPSGEAAILKALLERDGCSREMISSLTGFKKSTRNRYLQYMAARELIEFEGELVRAARTLFD